MKNYKVVITERLLKTLVINAESECATEEIVQSMYKNSEVVLTSDDYAYTTIGVLEHQLKPDFV